MPLNKWLNTVCGKEVSVILTQFDQATIEAAFLMATKLLAS